jgi:hypothetical protein
MEILAPALHFTTSLGEQLSIFVRVFLFWVAELFR